MYGLSASISGVKMLSVPSRLSATSMIRASCGKSMWLAVLISQKLCSGVLPRCAIISLQ